MATANPYVLTGPAGTRLLGGRFPAGNGTLAGAAVLGDASASGLIDAPALAPAGSIVQYLTHDGDMVGNIIRSSAPTSWYWNQVLQFRWRRGTLGDWLDSAQAENGSSAYASFGPLAALGLFTADVTALVSRWLTNGLNRGFYLRTRANDFPVTFAGRTHATVGARPALVVVTSAGTFTLSARCNATWRTSTTGCISSSDSWMMEANGQPAILQFDLASVTGTIISAELRVTLIAQERTTAMVDIFEADPPTIIVPESVASPALGLYASKANFQALASDPNVLLSHDFETPGFFDAGWGFSSAPADQYTPVRAVNSESNTTYAVGRFRAGDYVSADIPISVSVGGAAPHYPPNVVREELFGQYHLYLEPDFGTTEDTAIKIPAMGVQFGYWNPVGYWASTTGNGGSQGTGLRVTRGDGVYEYQGHSIRITTGVRPADNSAYDGYFAVAFYPYNLDQAGPFPAGESWPYVAIRTGQWYCLDLRVKQNTMSGAQDADGNYATANADGVLQAWVNGYQVYLKNTFRWRKHAEFGVQGLWIDFYHGGTLPANAAMHYRIDRVTVATSYIGPPARPLPEWVPPPGEVAALTQANGRLTNTHNSICADYFEPFYFSKIVNDYSGHVVNPFFGDYGALVGYGGGHAATNDNTLWGLVLGPTSCTFQRLVDPSPNFGSGTDSTTRENNSNANVYTLPDPVDVPYGEYKVDGKPVAPHSYAAMDVIGPANGGAAEGTFIKVIAGAGTRGGDLDVGACHQVPFPDTTGPYSWARRGTAPLTPNWVGSAAVPASGNGTLIVGHRSAFVASQQRIYFETHANTVKPRWFDLVTNTYVTGTGTAKTLPLGSGGGVMFDVPEHNVVVLAACVGGNLALQYLDTTLAQPSWVLATLSATLAVGANWSCACWCVDNDRIIVGRNADTGAVQEITVPAVLTDPWTVVRAALPSGQTIPFPTEEDGNPIGPWKKWSYNPPTKSIVYMPYAASSGDDAVYAYRPRNT